MHINKGPSAGEGCLGLQHGNVPRVRAGRAPGGGSEAPVHGAGVSSIKRNPRGRSGAMSVAGEMAESGGA